MTAIRSAPNEAPAQLIAPARMRDALASGEAATNYYRWLTDIFVPHLQGRVVEHGSGSGTLAARLLERGVAPLVLTEPDPAYGTQLGERFGGLSDVEVFQGTLEQYLVSAGARSVDAVVSSNVLEHVADDQGCLRAMFELLRPGGRLALYVPARPELYGPFDKRVGHHRRYRRGELQAKLRKAGFTVDRLQYRNFVGAIGWWYQNRFSGGAIESGVTLFDKVVFPITRRIEDLLPPPWGLNLLAFCRKPADE